ncbi:MAG: maleylpyruvate isomerase family mycothiol-dependent enzyme [Acidimicrobiales bacterium]|nr:maleylpyruvate isomerase family mycothiol-dependent enzyme [Acidimicrobiales bacterium]
MATPQDLATAYRDTRGRITELCQGISPDVASSRVPATPDWSVRDLVSHLTVIAAEPVAGNLPGNDQQAWMDEGMARRREASVADLLTEWNEAGPAFEGIIESMGEALRNVVYDVAVHEHDLRHALGRPGARDTPAVQIGLEALLDQLGDRVREHELAAVRVRIDDAEEEVVCGDGNPSVTLAGDRFELFRLLANRRSRNQVLSARWTGDPERYLGALEAMPYPEQDIDE